jgi:hypothetical protein
MEGVGVQRDSRLEAIGVTGILPGVQDVTGHLPLECAAGVTTRFARVECLVSEPVKVARGAAEELLA